MAAADVTETPRIRAALNELESKLLSAGYEGIEVDAISAGAREQIELRASESPDVAESELLAIIDDFGAPEIAAAAAPDQSEPSLIGNMALVSAIVGALILVSAFFVGDGDLGGALMILGVFLGGGVACLLGMMSRKVQTGKIGLTIGLVLWLSLAAFLVMP